MKPRPATAHVAKPASDPERGQYFWRHRLDDGSYVQLSTRATTLTPNTCARHGFAFDASACPACFGDDAKQGRLF